MSMRAGQSRNASRAAVRTIDLRSSGRLFQTSRFNEISTVGTEWNPG